MINQVMSVELAIGLSHVLQKDLTIHGTRFGGDTAVFQANTPHNDRRGVVREDHRPTIFDLLDLKPYGSLSLIEPHLDRFSLDSIKVPDLIKHYWASGEQTELEEQFADGRTRFTNTNKDIEASGCFGWYSSFFFNRTLELDTALASVRFKPEYYEFAELVAKHLGDFNGAHLRLTDNAFGYSSEPDFAKGLEQLSDKQIVLSTDQPFYETVMRHKNKFLLIDELIINNFSKEFKELDFQDEVVFGLICNLVMHHSLDFIGSHASTFSGYIQRNMHQKGVLTGWKWFSDQTHVPTGPFTWNGLGKGPETLCWWREWPESKLRIG